MTTAYKGRLFVLKVDNADSPTTFTQIAGLRNVRLSLNNNPVDITNYGSAGYQELLEDGGTQVYELSGDGLITDDSKTAQLASDANAKTKRRYQITSDSGNSFEGNFVITSFERTGGVSEAETFSVTLSSDGAITFAAS
jgi:TP901-1 family phage major tail protein